MRPFDHHIHALLLDHDCVIVPDLGGFIASRQRAHIDSNRMVGMPPKRSIAFNVYLRQNDGLLAKRLVDTEKIGYAEALQAIEQYVNECMQEMGRGGAVLIRNVGTLSHDLARNIQFEPEVDSPLCPDAFGLTPIPVHVLDSSATQTRRSRPAATKPKRQDSARRQRTLVSVLAVAGALLWFSFNLYLVSRDRYIKAGMNPLDSVLPEESSTPVNIPPPPPLVKVETVYVPAVAPESVKVEAPPEPTIENHQDINPKTERTTISSESDRYHIVAGVFKIRENADGLVRRLQSEGFESAGIIDTSGEFFYVSVASFDRREEAVAFHRELRSKEVSGWICRR